MVTETFDESRDCLVMGDFWDVKAHIREASDIIVERFVLAIMNPFKIILVSRLLTGGYEIVNESLV
jgi:hypothetical protein